MFFLTGNYFKRILTDYGDVAKETLQDMKARPIKSSVILSLLGATGTLVKTNPDEVSYREHLRKYANEMLLISDAIRNKTANEHLLFVTQSYNEGRIRRMNLGVCSIMWFDNYDKDLSLFKAQCKHLRSGWLEMADRTVDVGVFGHWLILENKMIDYDINTDEWPEETKTKEEKKD